MPRYPGCKAGWFWEGDSGLVEDNIQGSTGGGESEWKTKVPMGSEGRKGRDKEYQATNGKPSTQGKLEGQDQK